MEFDQGVLEIRRKDQRYDAQAYFFIREVLDFTVDHVRAPNQTSPHVHGSEILEGFRRLVLREFGPMALLVAKTWGLNRCRDVGNLVYNLINAGIFTKAEGESVEDFQEIYVFEDVFDHRKAAAENLSLNA